MDIHVDQILNKQCTVERHTQAWRYQLSSSEWCEIKLTFERDQQEEKWKVVEVFVSSHNQESNQMTLEGLEKRLISFIVAKNSSARSWDEAKNRAGSIFYYLQSAIGNYGINYVFGNRPC
jgi:hypothetical protein|tara:strand:+ start:235 stop:594 length:360 start_codon:yes stop_codon:yes gene_type:complete